MDLETVRSYAVMVRAGAADTSLSLTEREDLYVALRAVVDSGADTLELGLDIIAATDLSTTAKHYAYATLRAMFGA